ncbi:Lrp/AsnC family transcriptional regulator [Natronococcus occultus]|uniref:Transcriptional regulator n=1 Tax=Natronococcus occultus SP4 TaxID=694430 RepID=L0JZQ7_9EURY|nr:winged helix-turn-helix transcriptional regulator [Natronococcus occultus]AGB37589.1 transcriptional regulator [Natronococcus occultus SP4]
MGIRIDEIDERIIYRLTEDARHTSAPDIAEEVDVSPPTVRNRIRRLEEAGVIEGYHAQIDYEKLDGRLTNLFLCTAVATDRKRFAQRILDITGVVGVREVMTGGQNLHVTVVGSNTGDIRRIAQEMAALGIDIDDEGLFHRERIQPYTPFGPDEPDRTPLVTGIADLSDDADVVEIPVADDAPIAGKTLQAATGEGFITEDLLVVSIDREDRDQAVTPDGNTVIRPGDVATLFSRTGIADETLRAFTENWSED